LLDGIDKPDKLIYRLQKYLPWHLVVATLTLLQTAEARNQPAELICSRPEIPIYAGDQIMELLNLNFVKPVEILIRRDVVAHANLCLPSLQESKKEAPALSLVATVSDNKSDNGAGRSTAQKSSNESGWVEHILWTILFGSIGGAIGSLITLAMLSNVQI
jgi:hypothetical protein